MIIFLTVVALVLALAINVAMAINMSGVAAKKGYDAHEFHIFAWCFWLPPIGYLYVIALPDLYLQQQNIKLIKQNEEMIEILGSKTETKEEEHIQLPNL